MSYRAFKRLLGETSLERKCRFLFGAGVLLLLTLTLGLYAYLTETLAYAQAIQTCRMLVKSALIQQHLPMLQARDDPRVDGRQLEKIFDLTDNNILRDLDKEQHHFLTERDRGDGYEINLFKEFAQNEAKTEDSRRRSGEQVLLYYAPVRLTRDCMSCHQELATKKGLPVPTEDAVYALARIRMPTKSIEEGVHWNRALLMATAIVTATLIMLGSWIIVRYIIVKPVKHLKEVSDAISAGETQRPQRNPDRRRIRGPQPRIQPHAPQPGEHAGPVAQGERRPRPQG